MKTTIRALILIVVVAIVWHLFADRLTPFTNNARVKVVMTQIVPRISGEVIEVNAANGQRVEPGDVLARIDRTPYEIALRKAQANLQAVLQDLGAESAEVEAAQADMARATTDLQNIQLQAERAFELERKGLIPVARADDARAKLSAAESALERSVANLERAKSRLGPRSEDNPAFELAMAELADAELRLSWTEIQAPSTGGVTNLDIGAGAYASAGQPLMTFLDARDVWIEAYMTENNLGHVRVGAPAEVTLDIHPGRVFEGRVESFSAAAAIGGGSSDGLATPPRTSGWMRDPQRFPIRIVLPGHERGTSEDDVLFQLNGQADVIVYTGDNALLNTLGRWHIRLKAFLSYAY